MDEIRYIFDKLVQSVGGKKITFDTIQSNTYLDILDMVSYPIVKNINAELLNLINNFQFIFLPSNRDCLDVLEITFSYYQQTLFKTINKDDIAKVNFGYVISLQYIFMRT